MARKSKTPAKEVPEPEAPEIEAEPAPPPEPEVPVDLPTGARSHPPE